MINTHQPTHDITTVATLKRATEHVPDDLRVVVWVNGVPLTCEVTMSRCGDWVVLDVRECEGEAIK